jgi:hypothetical protein
MGQYTQEGYREVRSIAIAYDVLVATVLKLYFWSYRYRTVSLREMCCRGMSVGRYDGDKVPAAHEVRCLVYTA